MELNANLKKLESSLIRKVLIKSREIEDSINLTIGEPDIKTPKIIVEKSAEYMLNNQLSYSPLGGMPELRQEVAKFYNNKYKSDYTQDNVMINIGSTEGISTALRTILNPNDEVIVIKPAYPLYEALLNICGAKAVYIDTQKNNFKLDISEIESKITPKTKAIILNYPSNPSGIILSQEEVEEIGKLIEKNDIFLISDEIYSEVVFEGAKFISPSSMTNIKSKTIIINGFSKSHSMTGWRVGYVLADKELRDQMVKVSQYTVSSPSTLSQVGAIIALKEVGESEIADTMKIYKERADYVYDLLSKLGFDVIKPQGTFYVLADYSKLSDKKSLDFVMEVLENTGVAMIPSIAFGIENCIRISCTQELEVIKSAGKRLEEYFNKK